MNPQQSRQTIGVLIANLGTPEAPTPAALRRYLAEFLWDRRVVDLPRPLWWLILNGIILRTRPKRSAAAYRKVWTEAGSPLMQISQRQATALRERLGETPLVLGMRYGRPSIPEALTELREQGVEKILVLPLYPQYSSSTSASTFDAVAEAVRHWRRVPSLRFVGDYHLDPGYVAALAASIRDARASRDPGGLLLLSFHGTPQRFYREGDPYYTQCLATAQAVAAQLGLEESQWRVSFQSRFGREPWLQPYTDETLAALPGEGVKRVDVICPGFSADCLETLEEIGVENRDRFLAAGGGEYHYIPALNDRPDHVDALTALIERNLCAWR